MFKEFCTAVSLNIILDSCQINAVLPYVILHNMMALHGKKSWTSIGLTCFPPGFGNNRQKLLDMDTDAEADQRTRTKSRSCDVGSSRRRGSRQPDPNEKPELLHRTLFRRLIRLIQINQDQIGGTWRFHKIVFTNEKNIYNSAPFKHYLDLPSQVAATLLPLLTPQLEPPCRNQELLARTF